MQQNKSEFLCRHSADGSGRSKLTILTVNTSVWKVAQT